MSVLYTIDVCPLPTTNPPLSVLLWCLSGWRYRHTCFCARQICEHYFRPLSSEQEGTHFGCTLPPSHQFCSPSRHRTLKKPFWRYLTSLSTSGRSGREGWTSLGEAVFCVVSMCVCSHVSMCVVSMCVFTCEWAACVGYSYVSEHVCGYSHVSMCVGYSHVSEHVCGYSHVSMCVGGYSHVSEHVCVFTREHVCVCVQMWACLCVFTCEHVCRYSHVSEHVCVFTCEHVCVQRSYL